MPTATSNIDLQIEVEQKRRQYLIARIGALRERVSQLRESMKQKTVDYVFGGSNLENQVQTPGAVTGPFPPPEAAGVTAVNAPAAPSDTIGPLVDKLTQQWQAKTGGELHTFGIDMPTPPSPAVGTGLDLNKPLSDANRNALLNPRPAAIGPATGDEIRLNPYMAEMGQERVVPSINEQAADTGVPSTIGPPQRDLEKMLVEEEKLIRAEQRKKQGATNLNRVPDMRPDYEITMRDVSEEAWRRVTGHGSAGIAPDVRPSEKSLVDSALEFPEKMIGGVEQIIDNFVADPKATAEELVRAVAYHAKRTAATTGILGMQEKGKAALSWKEDYDRDPFGTMVDVLGTAGGIIAAPTSVANAMQWVGILKSSKFVKGLAKISKTADEAAELERLRMNAIEKLEGQKGIGTGEAQAVPDIAALQEKFQPGTATPNESLPSLRKKIEGKRKPEDTGLHEAVKAEPPPELAAAEIGVGEKPTTVPIKGEKAAGKQLWEMTPEEFGNLQPSNKPLTKIKSDLVMKIRERLNNGDPVPAEVQNYGAEKYVAKLSERKARDWHSHFFDSDHREVLRAALRDDRSIPRSVLEEYAGQKWADDALAKLETPPTAAAEKIAPVKAGGEKATLKVKGTGERQRVGPLPKDYSDKARDFVSSDFLDLSTEEGDAILYHVTTARDKVYKDGLRSRKELGGIEGLGGGIDNQDPGLVSVTFSESQAIAIQQRLELAIKAARGEVSVDDVLNHFDMIGDQDTPYDLAEILRAPDDVSDDWDMFDEWIKAEYDGKEYELLAELDDGLPGFFPGYEDFGLRVGLTGEKSALAKLDPGQVEVLNVAARKGAKAKHIPDEAELRFSPEDLWVVSNEPAVLNKPELASSQLKDKAPNLNTPDKPPTPSKVRTPEPVKPATTATAGLNKAEIGRWRKTYPDLDELPPAEREAMIENMAQAKKHGMVESASRLADEVLDSRGQRLVTAEEHAGMAVRFTEVLNELDDVTTDINKAAETHDFVSQALLDRQEGLLSEVDKLTRASDLGGRELGRALNMRKAMVNRQSYELADLVKTATARKGSRLTDKEYNHLKTLADDHKRIEADYKRLLDEHNKTLAEQERMAAEKLTVAEIRKLAGAKVQKRAELLDQQTKIKKQLEKLGYATTYTGVSPEALVLVGKLALNYARLGANTLDGVVKEVLKAVPDLDKQDVYRAIISRDPKFQGKARNEVQRRIGQLRTQAKLQLEYDNALKGIFEKIDTGKPAPLTAPEIKKLRQKINELRLETYRNTGMDPDRLERAVLTMNELQDQLQNAYRKVRKEKIVPKGELAEVRRKSELLRKEIQVDDALAIAEDQLRTGDFPMPEMPVVKEIPPELERKMLDLRRIQRRIRSAQEYQGPWTAGRVYKEAVNTLRTAKATADMSAVLRQGLILSVRHPGSAARAFGKSAKAFFSENAAEKIDLAIRSNPNQVIRDRAKLYLAELGADLTKREEMFMSTIFEKVPGVKQTLGQVVKASERHMTSYLNMIRADAFDYFLSKYPNATGAELKAWANWINVATGRGNLNLGKEFQAIASGLFFAPRFAWSRWEVATGSAFRGAKVRLPGKAKIELFDGKLSLGAKYEKLARVRKEIVKDYGALAGTGAVALTLAKFAGADVSLDPESADFGRIRVGNTRFDIWGGVQQPMRVFFRTGSQIGKVFAGDTDDIRESLADMVLRQVGYKAGPGVRLLNYLTTHKDFSGKDQSVQDFIWESFTPMILEDIQDAYKDAGLGMAGAVAPLVFYGTGANTYEDSETVTREKIRKLKESGKTDEAIDLKREWNDSIDAKVAELEAAGKDEEAEKMKKNKIKTVPIKAGG